MARIIKRTQVEIAANLPFVQIDGDTTITLEITDRKNYPKPLVRMQGASFPVVDFDLQDLAEAVTVLQDEQRRILGG